MRAIDEVKKEQTEALLELGVQTVRCEQLKRKILELAVEAEKLTEATTSPSPDVEPAGPDSFEFMGGKF